MIAADWSPITGVTEGQRLAALERLSDQPDADRLADMLGLVVTR